MARKEAARQKSKKRPFIWYIAVSLYSLVACLFVFLGAQIAPVGIVYSSIGFFALTAFILSERKSRINEDTKLKASIQSVSNKIRKIDNAKDTPLSFEDLIQTEEKKTALEDLPSMFRQTPTSMKKSPAKKKCSTNKPKSKKRTPPPLTAPSSRHTQKSFGALNGDPDLSMFSDTIVIELLHHALKHKQIEIFAQPVVRLPQRKTFALELFARLRAKAGLYMPANDFMEIAEKEKVATSIDNYLLIHCLKSIQNKKPHTPDTAYFLNISAATLSDLHFMHTLLSFLKQHKDLAPQLIFEMKQTDIETLSPKMQTVLSGLAKIGCRFSMDHINSTGLTPKLLKDRNIDFIKLDAVKLLNTIQDEKSFITLKNFFEKLSKTGVELIVERMESEKNLIELLDIGVHYGQGYLFGKPDHESIYKRAI